MRSATQLHDSVPDSGHPASVGRQVGSGVGWAVGAPLWMLIMMVGAAWLILGSGVNRSMQLEIAVRCLGLLLVCTSANVIRATAMGRAILRAWVVNVAALCAVVVAVFVLLVPQ